MTTLRIFSLLVIAAHWSLAVWHLFLVTKIPDSPEQTVNWLAISLATLLHIAVSFAVWKLSARVVGWVLLAFMLVVLGAGTYEHFLATATNNVLRVAPGDWTLAFQISVYVLVFLEVLGCWLAIRFLTRTNQTEVVREVLQRR